MPGYLTMTVAHDLSDRAEAVVMPALQERIATIHVETENKGKHRGAWWGKAQISAQSRPSTRPGCRRAASTDRSLSPVAKFPLANLGGAHSVVV